MLLNDLNTSLSFECIDLIYFWLVRFAMIKTQDISNENFVK